MKTQPFHLSLALAGGVTLASMIALNSTMAFFSSPLLASWVAHGVGAVISLAVLMIASVLFGEKISLLPKSETPIWAYLGGIPGAFTVILAAITVNSPLGLSGSIALIMAGQVLFGFVCDTLGLFGLTKRTMNINDGMALMLMVAGCLMTLFGRG
ncbi:DMT family transporter [uncultured Photobacterium sp.]|uniref:DMT family transporter n=1 Tax=uncultured Photobacterium sp. TaxID=173973 RepID=UPI0026331159|nr:DMT family transporter [uncultured Photobacterium sp.]